MKTMFCECDNLAHKHRNHRTPKGNPGHGWLTRFHNTEQIRVGVLSTAGYRVVCLDCKNDCYSGVKK